MRIINYVVGVILLCLVIAFAYDLGSSAYCEYKLINSSIKLHQEISDGLEKQSKENEKSLVNLKNYMNSKKLIKTSSAVVVGKSCGTGLSEHSIKLNCKEFDTEVVDSSYDNWSRYRNGDSVSVDVYKYSDGKIALELK